MKIPTSTRATTAHRIRMVEEDGVHRAGATLIGTIGGAARR
jgi:hypothetical protein